MNLPSQHQLRILAFDVGASIAVELAMIKLRRRLAYVPRKPKPRRVRRLVAAVSIEAFKLGVAEIYRQRLRIRAAIDQAAAAQSVGAPPARQARLPRQRTASRLEVESGERTVAEIGTR